MIRLRFNLSRGENFIKRKVTNTTTKEVKYFEPEGTQFLLDGCKLINNENSAKKIKNGSNKFVCSWIQADNITIVQENIIEYNRLFYNPRVFEHWTNKNQENLDNKKIKQIITKSNKVYIHEL